MSGVLKTIARSVARFAYHSTRRPIHVAMPTGKSTSRGQALICYIAAPFETSAEDDSHSNWREARVMARVLQEAGYDVSVIDLQSQYPIDFSKYELIIGFGDTFDRSIREGFSGIKILLATGANPCFQNFAEVKRLRAFEQRHGRLLSPRRTTSSCFAMPAPMCDAVFCLGNEFTMSTYRPFGRPVIRVPVSHTHHWLPAQINRNVEKTRKGFLWFGSGGAIHKGLDLVLDAMDLLDPDFRLHICGPVEREKDFFEFYRDKLTNGQRIRYHGFMDIRGDPFLEILRDTAFCVFPSCSEGGGSAALTCMSASLVPIVTPQASVDIDDFGFLIEDATPEGVAGKMRQAVTLSGEQIAARGDAAARFVETNHSIENYEKVLREALEQTIAQHAKK